MSKYLILVLLPLILTTTHGNEKFPPFNIIYPENAEIGSPVEFKCNLQHGQTIQDDYCYFTTPGKDLLKVLMTDNRLTDKDGNLVDGITGLSNSTSCGLKIEEFKESHIGQWKCSMDANLQDTKQMPIMEI